MKDLATVNYFAPVDRLSKILMQKTQSTDPLFFRILVSYYLAKVASMMRCNIKTLDRGNIPVSMYALNLALSGHGKGHSTNIVEEQVISEFRERFLSDTFPVVSDRNLAKIAQSRAQRKGTDPDDELTTVESEFLSLGNLAKIFLMS